VYALSKEGYPAVARTTDPSHLFHLSSRELLRSAGRQIEVLGPLMEEEAKLLYKKCLK
jgi:hypothetical protein